MHNEQARRLTATDARDKASECRDMARRVQKPEHRAMLEDMAETWDRLATHLHDGEAVPPDYTALTKARSMKS